MGPFLVFLVAALSVLLFAGLGASGSWRGAVRYLREWAMGMAVVVVIAIAIGFLSVPFM